MRLGVILPAAGRGQRFAADGGDNKLELVLGGREVGGERMGGESVLMRSAAAFAGRGEVACVVVAVSPDDVDSFELRWGDRLRERLTGVDVRVVAGGTVERWETVMRAVEAVPDDCTHIAVHDAARPLVSCELIDRCLTAAATYRAVIPCVRVASTVKRVAEVHGPEAERRRAGIDLYRSVDEVLGSGAARPAGPDQVADQMCVIETVDRRGLWAAQTPQVFDAGLLREAYHRLATGGMPTVEITDDASLIERMGGEPVVVVEGEPTNLKITEPADAELAQAIVAMREAKRDEPDAFAKLFDDEDE
ncbi:MAG: 2-C-methyl-D-erythritol 4-phosphate cytidylyltransferase [Planctomycetota bacterium]